MSDQAACDGSGSIGAVKEAVDAIAGEILKPCVDRSIAVAVFSAGVTALSVMSCALLVVAWFLAVTIEKWQAILN